MNKLQEKEKEIFGLWHELTHEPQLQDLLDEYARLIREDVIDLIENAGSNHVSMIIQSEEPCPTCLTGNTGTNWISQNDLLQALKKNYE